MITFLKRITWGLFLLIVPFISKGQQFKVVGYLTNWGNLASDASNVDYTKVTHINIAFINPTNSTGTLGPTSGLSSAVGTIHTNNAKVLISLGGANAFSSFPNWPNLIKSANRSAYIHKIMQMVDTYSLDGVDVDLEGSDVNSDYAGFVIELSDSIKKRNKLLTAALATWFAGNISNTTLTYFDWINVMSYDAYGTWTGPGQHSPYSNAVSDLDYWHSNKGVPQSKLVLGVPFYGYKWPNNNSTGSSSVTYCNLASSYSRAANQDSLLLGSTQVYYNGIPTIKQKTALAISNASGIMIWTLQFDCPTSNTNSLLRAINETVVASFNNSAPTVSLIRPTKDTTVAEGDPITLSANAADSDGSITQVSFYYGSTNIGNAQLTGSPYSLTQPAPGPGTYYVYAKAIDDFPATTISDSIVITVTAATSEQPYGGTPWTIPGKIEAENYDVGNNLGYYDSDASNQGFSYRTNSVDIEPCSDTGGGYDVGWTAAGEWLKYTVNVIKDSVYNVDVRVASQGGGGALHIEMDGVNITGTLNATNTGGWQNWTTVSASGIALTSGQKTMKISIDATNFNINYVNFFYGSPATGIFTSSASKKSVSIYPNPFQDNATIQVDLPESGNTKISLIDITGREVLLIGNSFMNKGTQSINFNSSSVPKGFYLCRILQENKAFTIGVSKE